MVTVVLCLVVTYIFIAGIVVGVVFVEDFQRVRAWWTVEKQLRPAETYDEQPVEYVESRSLGSDQRVYDDIALYQEIKDVL